MEENNALSQISLYLEKGEFDCAQKICRQILENNPKCAQAYLGALMAQLHVKKMEDLKMCDLPFENNGNYQNIMRFGNENLKNALKGYIEYIKERNENERKEKIYASQIAAMNTATNDEALLKIINTFKGINGYKDVAEKIDSCYEKIQDLKKSKEASKRKKRLIIISIILVCCIVSSLVFYFNITYPPKLRKASQKMGKCIAISAGTHHTVGLKADGTVIAIGQNHWGECNVESWTDIIAVSAGDSHTVGLKSDGTVVATGKEFLGHCCDVDEWTDIIAIEAGIDETYGLKRDGTVVFAGLKLNISGFETHYDDIAYSKISSWDGLYGLKKDGTVVNDRTAYLVADKLQPWTDIVEISAGPDFLIGLKRDGTVVATGSNEYGQCNVNEWKDIVAISAGENHTVGLKSNGTIVAVGRNIDENDVKKWKDIVAISAGERYTAGLKNNGKVIFMGEIY